MQSNDMRFSGFLPVSAKKKKIAVDIINGQSCLCDKKIALDNHCSHVYLESKESEYL